MSRFIAQTTNPIDALVSFVPYGLGTFLIVGAFIAGKVLGSWKLAAQIRELTAKVAKLELEAVTEAGKTLKEIQQRRSAYTDKQRDCRLCFDALIVAIKTKADTGDIDKAREAVCAAMTEKAMPAFRDWMDWEHLSKKSTPTVLRRYLEMEVLPELNRFADWQRVINMDRFTRELGLAPLKMATGTTEPFLNLLEGLSPEDRSVLQPLFAATTAKMRDPALNQ